MCLVQARGYIKHRLMGISRIEEHVEGCGEDDLGGEAGGSWKLQRGEKVAEWIQSASWQDLLQLLFCSPQYRTFPEPALLSCGVFCPWVSTRRQKGVL